MTKEDIKQICQIYDNLRRERDAATIAYNSDDTFWEHVLATYNFSRPSLPSNLDEAAHKYADSEDPTCPCEECLIKTFKAGAEWMAEQGETIEDEVGACQDAEMTPLVEVGPKTFKVGDKVIVQIRKK